METEIARPSLLWKLFDGVLVESVLMRYQNRITYVFHRRPVADELPVLRHRTGGTTRNLSTAEIVDKLLPPTV